MYMCMRNLIIASSFILLVSVPLSAEQKNYVPANPDKYPYKSVVIDKNGNKTNIDGAKIMPDKFKVEFLNRSPFSGKNHNFGVKATKEQVKSWNTDVRPDGKGLPDGQMNVAQGAEVFINKCAVCHGDFGEGVDKFPVLSGGIGTLNLHPRTGGDAGPEKTIGSYLPYIAPMFWYIQTAMPLSAPKSLNNDEVYGILGYILQLNEITVNGKDIEDNTIINKAFINSVHLPNEKGFEYNNLRKPDTKNIRCMKDCIDTNNIVVMHIKTDVTIVKPKFGEERWYYEQEKSAKNESNSVGKRVYENTCAGCHNTGLANSPKLGDKEAWKEVTKQSLKDIFNHAINGKNAMPPKGGDSSLTDEDVKNAVRYMIEKSK